MSKCALENFGGLCTTDIDPRMYSSLPVSGQNAMLEVLVVDTAMSSGCQQNNRLQENPGMIDCSQDCGYVVKNIASFHKKTNWMTQQKMYFVILLSLTDPLRSF
jgi:hypothetical protein